MSDIYGASGAFTNLVCTSATTVLIFLALWFLVRAIVWKPKQKQQEMIELINAKESVDIPIPPGSQLPSAEYLGNYLDPTRVVYYREVYTSKYKSQKLKIAGLTLLAYFGLCVSLYLIGETILLSSAFDLGSETQVIRTSAPWPTVKPPTPSDQLALTGVAETQLPYTPTLKPKPTTTPTPPPGYIYAKETVLGVSLARPEPWERYTGSKFMSGGNLPYTTYYLVQPDQIQLVSISAPPFPYTWDDEEEFISMILGQNREQLSSNGFKVIERFPNLEVAGQTTFALAFRITNPDGIDTYSIIMLLPYSNEDVLFKDVLYFQWASSEELSSTTRSIFLSMLPTISFLR